MNRGLFLTSFKPGSSESQLIEEFTVRDLLSKLGQWTPHLLALSNTVYVF